MSEKEDKKLPKLNLGGNLSSEAQNRIKELANEAKTARASEEQKKKQKQEAAKLQQKHQKYFFEVYPKCFTKSPKPLAIGINKVMYSEEEKRPEEERVSNNEVNKFLKKYVGSMAYQEASKLGASRINLQGEAVGTVTAEQAEHAAQKLEYWKKMREEQKKNKKNKPKSNRSDKK